MQHVLKMFAYLSCVFRAFQLAHYFHGICIGTRFVQALVQKSTRHINTQIQLGNNTGMEKDFGESKGNWIEVFVEDIG